MTAINFRLGQAAGWVDVPLNAAAADWADETAARLLSGAAPHGSDPELAKELARTLQRVAAVESSGAAQAFAFVPDPRANVTCSARLAIFDAPHGKTSIEELLALGEPPAAEIVGERSRTAIDTSIGPAITTRQQVRPGGLNDLPRPIVWLTAMWWFPGTRSVAVVSAAVPTDSDVPDVVAGLQALAGTATASARSADPQSLTAAVQQPVHIQPSVAMPNYGRLAGLARKGTEERYSFTADPGAGTGEWRSGGHTPIRLRLPGATANGDLPLLARVVFTTSSTPFTFGPAEGRLLLVDDHGRCLAKTFAYDSIKATAAWRPHFAAFGSLGLPVDSERYSGPRRLNRAYPGAYRWWLLVEPGWNLIPIVAFVFVAFVIFGAATGLF